MSARWSMTVRAGQPVRRPEHYPDAQRAGVPGDVLGHLAQCLPVEAVEGREITPGEAGQCAFGEVSYPSTELARPGQLLFDLSCGQRSRSGLAAPSPR
jgi:hypothetical protein